MRLNATAGAGTRWNALEDAVEDAVEDAGMLSKALDATIMRSQALQGF